MMMKDRIPLGKFITEYSVRCGKNEELPLYSVTNSRGFCKDFFVNKAERKDKQPCRIVPYGYFAYNPSRINVGSVDWQHCEEKVIVSAIYYVFSVSEDLDRQYLLYFLRSSIARQVIRTKAEGSIRAHLTLAMLKTITIPNVTLDEQRRCASVLDKVQHLIELRRSQLDELDELITARFVEMFGDMQTNPKEWPEMRLGEMAEIVPGRKRKLLVNGAEVMKAPLLECSSLETGRIDWLAVDWVDASKDVIDRFRLLPQDILIRETCDPDTLGQGVLVHEPLKNCIYQNHLIRVRLNQKAILPTYVERCLRMPRAARYFRSFAKHDKGSVNLNKRELAAFSVPVPPMPLQQEFAAFVEHIDEAKVLVQSALHEAQTLFESLTQEFFG